MKTLKPDLKDFYLLWSTQSLSELGSEITSFALTLWLYEKTGSALSTATLAICTTAPYVGMSIFAGALTDKYDKKKTMLVCDTLAAVCTVLIFALYTTGRLAVWHLYAVNVVTGLMNSVQVPASEVTYTLIVPKEQYQRTSGYLYLSSSLISIGSPLIAAALYGIAGLGAVIAVDLTTFVAAFIALALFIRIPEIPTGSTREAPVLQLVREGLQFLTQNPLVLNVIMFMSGVNLIASAFDAVLPALVIPRQGNAVLGIVTSCSGIAMVIGSLLVTVMPQPKDRVRVIYLTMLFSLGTENFLLAFSRNPVLWCVGQVLGWTLVPIMGANQNVIMRNSIPVELQGRVFACRNTLQFFTIPIGMALGGFLVDEVCEPFMAGQAGTQMAGQAAEGAGTQIAGQAAEEAGTLFTRLFGSGKGSGASLMMFILGLAGVLLCLVMGKRLKKYHYRDP